MLPIGVAPTAQAADQWGGIATGDNGHWSIWFNKPDQTRAKYFGNWVRCGADCKRVLVFAQCGALAYNGGAFSPAEGMSLQEAEANALADLPGGWIVGSKCNDGGYDGQFGWRSVDDIGR